MSTYAIGDVHGCLKGLEALLDAMSFNPQKDRLWFCGDLVNRGPDSLAVLRYLYELPHCQMVLGNHDLHALALYHNCWPEGKKHTLDALMAAPDCGVLMDWLRHQPLLIEDQRNRVVMTHAGIYPLWSLAQARLYAEEVARVLRSDRIKEDLLAHMYGNVPDRWQDDLVGPDRLRFIVNALTRMRYLDDQLRLDFKSFEVPPIPNRQPWYQIPNESWAGTRILFGHWASLQARPIADGIIALDGGYVWGHHLVGYDLSTGQRWRVERSVIEPNA